MPAAIPELTEIGPALGGAALTSLRVEVQRLLRRSSPAFPGTDASSRHPSVTHLLGAQPVSLLKSHYKTLVSEE